jgi:DNA-binding transcriptional MocR family regulator
MRINFSFSNKEEIETGVKRLSDVIRDELYSK